MINRLIVLVTFFIAFPIIIANAHAENLISELRKIYPMYADIPDDRLLEGYRKKFHPNKTIEDLYAAFERRGRRIHLDEYDVTINFPWNVSKDEIDRILKYEILPHFEVNSETWYISEWPEKVIIQEIHTDNSPNNEISWQEKMLLDDINSSLNAIEWELRFD